MGSFFFVMFFLALLSFAMFAFWVWMLVHAIQHHIESKALWIIIILLFSFLGSVVYYFAVKRKFDEEQKKTVTSATQAMPNQSQTTVQQ